MALYVYVYSSETGLPITNATFSTYAFSNLGNGAYYLWAPANVGVITTAPGKQGLIWDTDSYVAMYIHLPNYAPPPPPHSQGYT